MNIDTKMAATIISIPSQDAPSSKERRCLSFFVSHTKSFAKQIDKYNNRQVLHSVKLGTALVIASLLYLLDPLYKQVGQNGMWAIITVIIIHEFSAGATLSKGLNRGMGTLLGGLLGCLVALIAHKVGGIGTSIITSTSVFVCGTGATYMRMIPSVKKRHDYGVMIFALTFNLVVVSGVRREKIIELALERLSTIGIGIGISCFTSLFLFPVWAGEELHCTLASELDTLAQCIEGFFEEYFQQSNEKERQCVAVIDRCKEVLCAKPKAESLANFARWEPWHGNFSLSYPWSKYLEIGDNVRELAAVILSLKGCLERPKETSSELQQPFKEPCEGVAYSIAWILHELAESTRKMKKCLPRSLINLKLETMRLELNILFASSKSNVLQGGDKIEIASLVFLLMTMMEKAEKLVKEVEELGDLASFIPK